ncbi:MAG: RsmB/NOP family class I SAM-dependent RNA methyltransferase [Planctomycetota bacterium]|jgi:16S rRNA (cytosine967-C5)-methyltransferase
MTGQKPITARNVAVNVLNGFDPVRCNAGDILNKLLQHTAEKQRATDLVFGTIRNLSAIDTVIAKLADCPAERIPPGLLNIIRIAAYELIYSPKTAQYAIVNEAVENAKITAGKKQTGFANAVLRQITRHIRNRRVSLSAADAEKTLPQTYSVGCEFDVPFLPKPELSPADYFSNVFSLPKWLVTDWLDQFGVEQVRQVCFAGNRRPSIYIRPNGLKIAAQDLAQKFRQADIDLEIMADGQMMKIKSPRAVTELPGFDRGMFSIQDITASKAVTALKPQSDWTILDYCAAPGSKTTQLAELTGDKAKIIATDIDSRRLEKVRESTTRLGINSVSIVVYDKLQETAANVGPFDCVLLDVPCSNTGVLAKRPEVRYRIKPKAIIELTKIQSRLLDTAADMIRPQGKICYSTCSIQKCENSERVRQFLNKNPDFKLQSEQLILPSAAEPDHDGGYVAIIAAK